MILWNMLIITTTMMTSEQDYAFNNKFNCVENSTENIFFLDATGGTGKTFSINLLLVKVQSFGKIALGGIIGNNININL